jgi:hypothetical protein
MEQSPFTPICQSCAMPMKVVADFGTNANASQNQEYCTHCYQHGQFTAANITMDQMIQGCIGIMVQYGMPAEQAKIQMETTITTLKSWKQ